MIEEDSELHACHGESSDDFVEPNSSNLFMLRTCQRGYLCIFWMWLAREPGAGSGERGAGKKRVGSRDCRKKSRNR
jgi:hypothetical protein